MKQLGVYVVASAIIIGAAVIGAGAADLFIYPQKGQTPEQQEQDEFACYKWAKENSGVDPSTSNETANQRGRSTVGGAAKGAALGAAVGAIAGDAGKGAAAGAVVGGVGGRQSGKRKEEQAVASQKSAYNRAFAACMEARGYTVK